MKVGNENRENRLLVRSNLIVNEVYSQYHLRIRMYGKKRSLHKNL